MMPGLATLLVQRRAEILAAWERSARLLHRSTPLGRPILADQIAAMLDSVSTAGGGTLHLPTRLDGSFELGQVILEIETLRTCITTAWQSAGDGVVSLREMRIFDQVFDTTISEAIRRYSRARELSAGLAMGAANAGRLVRDVLEEYTQMAEQKGIRLRGIDELLGADLMCDRNRIAQVFGTILGNAIKVCRSGDEILVRAVVGETEARFAISDPGPGMTAEELSRVFDAASGLDLYVSKGIIHAHKGTLWAESSLGDGTTFFFTLPLAR
jgi:signal transduction histidine kinase